MYQNIQAFPNQYAGLPPALSQPAAASGDLPQCPPSAVTTSPPPGKSSNATTDKPQNNGLRVFEIIHIGLMSTIGSFFMSSITHTKYSKVLPLNLLTNTVEALAVSAICNGKVPFINKLVTKKEPARPQNQDSQSFANQSAPGQKAYLPHVVSFINAASCLALMITYMLKGKMKDQAIATVSNQALQEGFRRFVKGAKKQPKQISKLLPDLMQLSSNYIKGHPFFRFMNRNPVLAVLLPVAIAGITGFIEGKASTRIADKTNGKILHPGNWTIPDIQPQQGINSQPVSSPFQN